MGADGWDPREDVDVEKEAAIEAEEMILLHWYCWVISQRIKYQEEEGGWFRWIGGLWVSWYLCRLESLGGQRDDKNYDMLLSVTCWLTYPKLDLNPNSFS